MRDTQLSQLPSIDDSDLRHATGGAGLLGGLLSGLFKGGGGKGLLGNLLGGLGGTSAGGDATAQAPQSGG